MSKHESPHWGTPPFDHEKQSLAHPDAADENDAAFKALEADAAAEAPRAPEPISGIAIAQVWHAAGFDAEEDAAQRTRLDEAKAYRSKLEETGRNR